MNPNIAAHIKRMAIESPELPAVITHSGRHRDGRSRWRQWNFAQLEEQTNRCANGLQAAGITRGMRVLVMVRPGFDFVCVSFALLKCGGLPVLIDPGMGIRGMLRCIGQIQAEALIGIPQAHAVRRFARRAFGSVKIGITVGRRWAWRGPTLASVCAKASDQFDPVEFSASDPAAILFTSGSTGPAKGVLYEHGMFAAQVRALRSTYGFESGEVKVATFPLFALFCPGLGLTCVIPEMDASRPAQADPAKIIEAIRTHRASSVFGSPALWRRVVAYGQAHNTQLDSLKRVLVAGAPVPAQLISQIRTLLPDPAEVYTPYGATECLPVTSISGRELSECSQKTEAGAGICVGRPLDEVTVRTISITDDPLAIWDDSLALPPEVIGEIVVKGAVVTRSYVGLDHATRLAKIPDGDDVWHRIGDVGYFDASGRLWYCGRKAHHLKTIQGPMFTIQCETIFNQHPAVARCALVGTGLPGRHQPLIVIEPVSGKVPTGRRREELLNQLSRLGSSHELTRSIDRFAFRRSLPVDPRHNAKINRELLTAWAEATVL